MGRFDTKQFRRLLEFLGHTPAVASCLPYPNMTPIPAGFDQFAHHDARQAGLEWSDACPAYALAVIASGSYGLPQDDADMEVLWDELSGQSTKLWPEVRGVVVRSWVWLDAHHPDLGRGTKG